MAFVFFKVSALTVNTTSQFNDQRNRGWLYCDVLDFLHSIDSSINAYYMWGIIESGKNFVDVFNPLQPGVAFLYPLKTSENLKVFWCFQGT